MIFDLQSLYNKVIFFTWLVVFNFLKKPSHLFLVEMLKYYLLQHQVQRKSINFKTSAAPSAIQLQPNTHPTSNQHSSNFTPTINQLQPKTQPTSTQHLSNFNLTFIQLQQKSPFIFINPIYFCNKNSFKTFLNNMLLCFKYLRCPIATGYYD